MQESLVFDTPSAATPQPSAFQNFTLLRTTALSNLYRAHKAGKQFLIKTTKDGSERQLAMLQREYEISISCDHPHIVHVYTIEEQLPMGKGIIMEYVEGRTLGEFLAERPSTAERNRVFEELLSAVSYLHTRGIIHNDLKPENILITRANNTVKLIDFGLADSDSEFAFKQLGCTPRYAAPELAQHTGNSDARTDIYAIGILMGDLFPNRHKRMARRCTHPVPARRYPHVEALLQTWRRRNLPLKIAAVLLLAIAVFLPISQFVMQSIEQRRYTQHCTEQLNLMQHTIDSICTATTDSINNTRYMDFAQRYLKRMSDACHAFSNKMVNDTPDPALQAMLSARFGTIYQEYWVNLVNRSATLPYLDFSGLPKEEIAFYKSLLEQDLPYRPYSKNEFSK